MVIPSEIVKTLEINPQFVFLLLKIRGKDDVQLKIIKEADLEKKDVEYGNPVDIKFRNLPYKSMILKKVFEMINTQPSNSNNNNQYKETRYKTTTSSGIAICCCCINLAANQLKICCCLRSLALFFDRNYI